MSRLEYRQLNAEKNYPVLCYFEHIDNDEIAARFACDYYIRDRLVYERTSCAVEPDGYVIYIRHDDEAQVFDEGGGGCAAMPNIRMELRQYKETAHYYPVIHVFEFKTNLEAALTLQADYIWWLGQEWRKSSTEIDEDRKVYVYYAEPVT